MWLTAEYWKGKVEPYDTKCVVFVGEFWCVYCRSIVAIQN